MPRCALCVPGFTSRGSEVESSCAHHAQSVDWQSFADSTPQGCSGGVSRFVSRYGVRSLCYFAQLAWRPAALGLLRLPGGGMGVRGERGSCLP